MYNVLVPVGIVSGMYYLILYGFTQVEPTLVRPISASISTIALILY